jgi:hypothetical protein
MMTVLRELLPMRLAFYALLTAAAHHFLLTAAAHHFLLTAAADHFLLTAAAHHLLLTAAPHRFLLTAAARHLLLTAAPHRFLLTAAAHHLLLTAAAHHYLLSAVAHHFLLTAAAHHFLLTAVAHHFLLTAAAHHLLLTAAAHHYLLTAVAHHFLLTAAAHHFLLTAVAHHFLLTAAAHHLFFSCSQEDVLYALNEEDACATLGMKASTAKDRNKMVYLLTTDGAPTDSMRYLKTVFDCSDNRQWANFVERIKGSAAKNPAIRTSDMPEEVTEYHFMPGEVLHPYKTELLLWASNRGQLLARTVRGMMAYRRALLVHAELENPCFEEEEHALSALAGFETDVRFLTAAVTWQELYDKRQEQRRIVQEATPEEAQFAAAAKDAIRELEVGMLQLQALHPACAEHPALDSQSWDIMAVQDGLRKINADIREMELQRDTARELRRLLLEEMVDMKYQYVISGQMLGQMARNKGSLKAQWTVHGMELLCKLHPSLKVACIDKQTVVAAKEGQLVLVRDASVLQRSEMELKMLRVAGVMGGTEAFR